MRELIKVRSVFTEENISYNGLLSNCLVIVIVYAKSVNRGITNKAIVIVYIKLRTVVFRIVRIKKNFN